MSGPRSESSNGEPWYIDPDKIQKSQQQQQNSQIKQSKRN